MNFFDHIREWFIKATQWLVDAAMWCYNSALPLDGLGDIFNDLSDWTSRVAGYLFDASDWYDDVMDELEDILSWTTIRSKIRTWLDGIEDLVDWWENWWTNIKGKVDDWWEDTLDDVKGWIAAAVEGLASLLAAWDTFWNDLWPTLTSLVDTIKAAWDAFIKDTLPNLLDLTFLTEWWNDRVKDVQDLIDTGFKLRDDFWKGWQDIRDTVLEFFDDPLEWLWARFTDWFLGPEE